MPSTEADSSAPALRVVAGALVRDDAVLLARRLPNAHLAGLWEFPGGKVEPGEGATQALVRELREEIGITAHDPSSLIRFPYRYPEFAMDFEVFRVTQWEGTPRSMLGQPLEWVAFSDVYTYDTPPASQTVLRALRLPPHLAITPDATGHPQWQEQLARLLCSGIHMLQFRAPALDAKAYRACAQTVVEQAHAHQVQVLLNAPPEEVAACSADGVHLNSTRLHTIHARPLPAESWVGASCHSMRDLEQAYAIGADFAVLSVPGKATWDAEFFTTHAAQTPLPVYAIGGLGVADCAQIQACGGQGIAAIRGFWDAV